MKLFQSSLLKTKPKFQLILVALGTIDLAMIISDKISLSEFAGTHIEYLFLSVLLWMIMLMNLWPTLKIKSDIDIVSCLCIDTRQSETY